MAIAEEGGATANTTSSSYGGGGAGGKFLKKPFRRQSTPYDRPPTALRGNKDNNSSWLKKLVVEPASKLISYGTDRFFASLLHKRLPPPALPQPLEAEAEAGAGVSDGVPGTILNIQDSQPINSSSSNGVSELEQLLKQRTFTRSEIVHLRELLQSRALEVSLEDIGQKNEDTALDFARHQQLSSGLLEENRNVGNRSAFMSTPGDTKVLEDDNASPAELAKAYMGSRPSKVSSSLLGMHSRVGREDLRMLSSLPSASGSPVMALTNKTPNIMSAQDNGFITPKYRGKSAIYNMARTPYSKVHPTSSHKGNGISSSGYVGLSMSSSYLLPVESDEKFESRPMSLKRRSSALDNELGSVGPIRRIRQKPNLLASRLPHTTHGLGVGSHANQKVPLIAEPSYNVSKDVGESVPSSSYARVPSKSSDVASKILQHLEKMTPKDKLSESKLVARREISPLTLTPNMLSGQAFRRMDSSKLLLDVHDDHKLGSWSNATSADTRYSSKQKQEKVEENGPKESIAPSDKWNSVANNDSVLSLKASAPSTSVTDSIVETGASQPPQKKRAFRMSAEEDYFEQDDDAQCNGLASRPFPGNKRPMEAPLTDSKVAPFEEPKLVKPSIQPADQSPPALISRKTSEPYPGAVAVGEVSSVVSLPPTETTEETTTASPFSVLPSSVAAFDKPKESNNAPVSSFSSKVVEKIVSVPSDYSKEAELKLETSSSLVNVSASVGSQVKTPESDKTSHLKLLKADVNGKSDTVPSSASNRPPPFSSPSPVFFTAASSNDTNQITKDKAFMFTSLSSSGPTSTSTPATSSSSIFGLAATSSNSKFGLAAKPSSLGEPGPPVVDPATSVSAASTTSVSEVADLGSKAEMVPHCGSSSSSLSNVAFFAAASSGSSTFGLGSASFSAPNNLQGSLFATASKPLVSGAGSGLQDTSTKLVPSVVSLSTSNINSSISFGSSSSSQVLNPSNLFGVTLPATSSDKSAPIPSSDRIGANPTEGSTVTSSSGATAGIFSFGLSSTSAVGSSASLFSFSATSTGSALLTNTATASSLSNGTVNTASASFLSDGAASSDFSGFHGNSSASSSSAPANNNNVFGSSWQQSPKSPIFGSSTFTAPSPSTGCSFSASSSPSTTVFNSSSSGPAFSVTLPSSNLSTPSAPVSQLVFGNNASIVSSGFGAAASPDQMNADDSMAEDPVQQQSSAVVPPMFGQPHPASAVPPMFGQAAPSSTVGFAFGSQPGPFRFGGQQNQVAPPQNPSLFQASGSVDFNAGGSFSLGSGGGDKSARKIVKISRSKNRRK